LQIQIKFRIKIIYSEFSLGLTVTALVVLGYAQDELKEHIRAALHVGCSREEILQMAVYAGFPAALQANKTAAAVFSENTETQDG
jgi:4-carboxymuconolactone decarboxylase